MTTKFFEPTPAPIFPDWFAKAVDWEYSDRRAVAEDHRKIGFAPSLEVIPEEKTASMDDNDQEEDHDSSDWGSGWVESSGRHRRYSMRLSLSGQTYDWNRWRKIHCETIRCR